MLTTHIEQHGVTSEVSRNPSSLKSQSERSFLNRPIILSECYCTVLFCQSSFKRREIVQMNTTNAAVLPSCAVGGKVVRPPMSTPARLSYIVVACAIMNMKSLQQCYLLPPKPKKPHTRICHPNQPPSNQLSKTSRRSPHHEFILIY